MEHLVNSPQRNCQSPTKMGLWQAAGQTASEDDKMKEEVATTNASVKVFGMPASANSCSPILLAMEAGAGGFEMCNLMEGEHMKPEFLKMNPFHHIPTIKDGSFTMGESIACLRYLALKYKPEYYPVEDPVACGVIDFAAESFGGDVYPKIGYGVFYSVFEFAGAPEDQSKANEEASAAVDTWMKHFIKGKFVNGDKVSIADFKAVTFLFAAMQPAVEMKTGFKLADRAKQYVECFIETVKASAFLKSAGGYAIAEYAASKVPDAGAPAEVPKATLSSAPAFPKPAGANIKVLLAYVFIPDDVMNKLLAISG